MHAEADEYQQLANRCLLQWLRASKACVGGTHLTRLVAAKNSMAAAFRETGGYDNDAIRAEWIDVIIDTFDAMPAEAA